MSRIIKQLPFWSFFNDFVKIAQEHGKWPISGIWASTSKKCGKTDGVVTFANDMCNCYDVNGLPVSCKFVVIRKSKDGERDIFKQFCNIFHENFLSSSFKDFRGENNRHILFANGNEIYFLSAGIRKSLKGSTGSGRPSIVGDYIVLVFDEISEFTRDDITGFESWIRSFNPKAQVLSVKLGNPYYPTHYFYKEFYRNIQIDMEIMKTTGYQFKVCDVVDQLTGLSTKNLLIQGNWRAIQNFKEEPLYINGTPTGYNRYVIQPNKVGPEYVLTQNDLDIFVRHYGEMDKDRAMVEDLGIPGNVSDDNIFYSQWQFVKPAVWEAHTHWRVGIDVGYGATEKSGKTVVYWIGYTPGHHGDIYDELVIDLETRKTLLTSQYDLILDWLEAKRKETLEKTGVYVEQANFRAIVDNSATGFINFINARAGFGDDVIQGRCMNWINFEPCELRTMKMGESNDYKVSMAIPYTRDNFSNGFWRCDKVKCPELDNEFTINEFKKDNAGNSTLKMQDGKDDGITAFWYGIEELIIYQ